MHLLVPPKESHDYPDDHYCRASALVSRRLWVRIDVEYLVDNEGTPGDVTDDDLLAGEFDNHWDVDPGAYLQNLIDAGAEVSIEGGLAGPVGVR